MQAVRTRVLGRSGIEVSAMGMGCWAIGGPTWAGRAPIGWGEVDDDESIRAIHAAMDLGVTFFDTANVYGAGHSERVLAKAFAGRRDKVVIATKFGLLFDENSRQIIGKNASEAHIREACEASLRRLNCDYIDLYQFHLSDYGLEEATAVRQTLEALVTEGKIRAYGWSTDYADRARFIAEGRHCTAIQHTMNVLEDAASLVAICEELNLVSINRGPLAMGLLTGKYQADTTLDDSDIRGKYSPAWLLYFKDGKPNPEWLNKLTAVREILTSNGRTLAQGALAWLWARSPQTIPIPGFRTVAQVTENCGAMQFGLLTAVQMQEINDILNR